MEWKPEAIVRRDSRQIDVGGVKIGGKAPIYRYLGC